MTRCVALITFFGGLGVSAPVAAAETWVLWARPCDLAGQTCTGDWQRRRRAHEGARPQSQERGQGSPHPAM